MPTGKELRAMGLGGMVPRVNRSEGGVLGWAKRLGLEVLPDAHSPAFGEAWERVVAEVLTAHRRTAELQRRRSPFDILTDNGVRVNVKASRYHDYHPVNGYTFWLGTTWKRCDVFALVKVAESSQEILWVPSCDAQQQTITLTGKHRFNAFTSMDVLDATYP